MHMHYFLPTLSDIDIVQAIERAIEHRATGHRLPTADRRIEHKLPTYPT